MLNFVGAANRLCIHVDCFQTAFAWKSSYLLCQSQVFIVRHCCPHPVKKLRWLIILIALVAVGLLASRVLCPHPEHWLDNLLYATGLKHVEEPPDFDSDSLRPQEPVDYAAYEPAVCAVHQVEMRAEIVPIHYGLPGWAITTKDGRTLAPPSDPPSEVREQQFPHAEHFAGGGCVTINYSPNTARIRICSECERAEQQWRAQHPLG